MVAAGGIAVGPDDVEIAVIVEVRGDDATLVPVDGITEIECGGESAVTVVQVEIISQILSHDDVDEAVGVDVDKGRIVAGGRARGG